MTLLLEATVALLLLLGAAFVLLGSIGLARMPDILTRLHGPTKATTLGLGALIAAIVVHNSVKAGAPQLAELAISLFLFLTAPISAHLIAKAAKSGSSS